MAQTTLTMFAGDQLYKSVDFFFSFPPFLTIEWHSYVLRLTGTFIGLIVGLLAWYIGGSHYHFLTLPPFTCDPFRECPLKWQRVRDGSKLRCFPCASYVHPALRAPAISLGHHSHGGMSLPFVY